MSLYTAPSGIHGFGLYTTEKIKENQQVGIIFNRINNTGIFVNDFKENLFGRFTNHSEQSNTKIILEQSHVALYAIRTIEPAEEITADYNKLIEQFNNDESLIKMIKFW